MEITAQLQYAHAAPRKMRLVADAIRGMEVVRAEVLLNHMPKRASLAVLKLLKSARANATHNFQLDGSDLYVKDIKVNAGPVAKRMMPRAFGRAATIRKRTSHLVMVLDAYRTEDGAARRFLSRREEPIIRDAEIQDAKAESFSPGRKVEALSSSQGVKKSLGFARRIFRRKAI